MKWSASCLQGQVSDIAIHAQEILRMRTSLNEIYAHHTGQPVDVIGKANCGCINAIAVRCLCATPSKSGYERMTECCSWISLNFSGVFIAQDAA